MFPFQHFWIGIVFSALFVLAFPSAGAPEFFIILFSTVLIDVDHYLYYVYEKKSWNLFKAYRWFVIKHSYWLKLSKEEKNKHKGSFYFLHGVEVLAILLIMGFTLHPFFNYVLIGFAFHVFLDILYTRKYQTRIDKLSVIHDYFKFKKWG
jgi:hypothetical protein